MTTTQVKDLKPAGNAVLVKRTSDDPIRPPVVSKYYGTPAAVILPERFFIERINADPFQNAKVKELEIVDAATFTKQKIRVPVTLEVELVETSESQKILEKFGKFKIANIDQYVRGPLSTCVGADPEIFVEDSAGNLIPAFKFLKSKEEPNHSSKKDALSGGGQPIYWDGFQAEFNVKAGTCLAYVCDSTYLGLRGVYRLAKRNADPKARLSLKTVVEVPLEVLQNTEPEYVAFGCTPSLNIYGLRGRELDGREVIYRSTGGHIHFGFGSQPEDRIEQIVKSLDAILGVACVSLFAKYDHPVRREYYGLPGEYRLPKHGLEYRTLSNAWLSHPAIMNLVFDLARKVCNFGYNNLLPFWDGDEEETIKTLLTCDVDKAREILQRNKQIMLGLFRASYYSEDAAEIAFNTFLNGMESVVEEPENIVKNWSLNAKANWKGHCEGTNHNWSHAHQTIKKGKKI